MRIERELMRGAGPVAVLELLAQREMYGWELINALEDRTDGVLAIGQSSLYPMLYNLEAKELVKSRWRETSSGRRRKYYSLTARGKKRLLRERKQWAGVVEALTRLGTVPSAPDGGTR